MHYGYIYALIYKQAFINIPMISREKKLYTGVINKLSLFHIRATFVSNLKSSTPAILVLVTIENEKL